MELRLLSIDWKSTMDPLLSPSSERRLLLLPPTTARRVSILEARRCFSTPLLQPVVIGQLHTQKRLFSVNFHVISSSVVAARSFGNLPLRPRL